MGSSTENPRPPSLPLWLCRSLPALIQEVLGQGACHSLKRETKEQPGFPPSLPFSGKQTSLCGFFIKEQRTLFLPSLRPWMQGLCQEQGSLANMLCSDILQGNKV